MAQEWLLLVPMAIPIGVAISIVIATWYYNRNYYLETKIKYLQEKKKSCKECR